MHDAEVNEPGEAEFVFFDRVGRELVGAPLISLLRHGRSPIAPLLEIVQSARGDPVTPRELSAVISRKFRFVVSISSKCFTSDDDELSFQVLRIDTPLGKQPQSSVAYRASSVTTGATGSGSLPNESPPPLAAPCASSNSLPPGSSTPPPSVVNTPESQALLPALSSPPSVTKPSVTSGVASEVKPKAQRCLFKDKTPVSATPVISDPVDNALDDEEYNSLGSGSVAEQEGSPLLAASTETDDLPVPDQASDAKKPRLSVPADA